MRGLPELLETLGKQTDQRSDLNQILLLTSICFGMGCWRAIVPTRLDI